MKHVALPVSMAMILCCLMVCNTVEYGVDAITRGQKERLVIETEARVKSIREQLQMQIGAILQAAPEAEEGALVLPLPFVPESNKSAE